MEVIMVQTNPDGQRSRLTHIHTPKCVCGNYASLTSHRTLALQIYLGITRFYCMCSTVGEVDVIHYQASPCFYVSAVQVS